MSAVAEAAPAVEEERVTYEFDADFQTKITALSLRDTEFLNRTEGLIDPKYFERDAEAAVVQAGLDFYNKYKKAPDRGTMAMALKESFSSRRVRKDIIAEVKLILPEVMKTDISDREFVVDQVAEFARNKALALAIIESYDLLEKRNYGAIKKLIDAASLVGANDAMGGYDYWEEIKNRTAERVAMMTGTIKPDGITTGMPDLDKYLYHKGWGRKELSIILGKFKSGKSISLGQFAKDASLAGFNVLYASLELYHKIIADRTDANVADMALRIVGDNPIKVQEAVEKASSRAGKMIYHSFPSGTLKPSQLRRLLRAYRAKGIIFDLIVVDYLDIMRAENPTDQKRDNLDSIAIDLRAIAYEENAAMLTATQSTREGGKSATLKGEDVAEDINKVRHCDILLSINATDDEKASDEVRIYFAVVRNGEDNFTLRFKSARERMKFLSKFLSRE